MARYTAAYSSFVVRQKEVEVLRKLALNKEKQDPVNNAYEINALCRASVVLLSGHLEAYIKELGEIAIDSLFEKSVPRRDICSKIFYHISKNYIDEIKDTSSPDLIADKVFSFIASDIEFWSRDGFFPKAIPVERFNKGFSNPAFKKIKSYFNRFGYNTYQGDIASKLKANFPSTKNMIDHLVYTRNRIAHGDPSATKTPTEIRDMIQIVKKFCLETDNVFASWWRENFCAIR